MGEKEHKSVGQHHEIERGQALVRPPRWVGYGIVAALTVLVVAVVLGVRWLEENRRASFERGDASLREQYYELPTIEYQGSTYRRKRNLTAILLMGIDKYTMGEDNSYMRNGGQADFLRLLVIDDDDKVIRQVAIDRDTMTPITILGVLGNRAGSRTERISLSHGFGDGREQSCELTVDAVENYLYGAQVDYYLALDMDGISELNEWLGGVTVTLEDDFTVYDPAMKKGETLRLVGDQAELFVRSRSSLDVSTNEARMGRQEVFLNEAAKLLRNKLHEDENAAADLYDSLNSFFVTNMSRGSAVNVTYLSRDYQLEDVLHIDGTHSVDEQGFTKYIPSDNSVQDTIIEAFYERVQ